MLVYLSLIEAEEDKSKFEQIYQRYRQLMYYTANRILGDTKDSEDVVHESFLKIIGHLEKIMDPYSPQTRSLIVIITENKAIDLYRKRRAQKMLPFDEEIAVCPTPDTTANVEDSDIVARTIAALPEQYRAVLLLKYAQGYSTEEIADMLSISKENVKKRIQRARNKLESLLEQEEADCL